MLLYHIILLAVIQGLTEFLPISSSAHLILPSQILAWPDQGLAFDLAVHLGTLMAVIVYLWRDVWAMLRACLVFLKTHEMTQDVYLALMIIVATLPAVIVGYLVKDWVELYLRSILVIALASIGFGLLLAMVDSRAQKRGHSLSLAELGLKQSIWIGLAQVLAFIPGTSRSGITITAALALGFARQDALRFSFFLSIPIILAGSLLSGLDLLEAQASASVWQEILLGMSIAGISAFTCIHFFISWVDKLGMLPFVIYRVVLGFALLLIYFYY